MRGADHPRRSRESVARALHAWRTAEAALRAPCRDPRRPSHERAVRALQDELRRFDSVADLIGHYAAGGLTRHAAVASACSGAQDARLPAIIEGAAFWRRIRELVTDAVR